MAENVKRSREEEGDNPRLLELKEAFLELRKERVAAIERMDIEAIRKLEMALADVQEMLATEFPDEYPTLLHELVERSPRPQEEKEEAANRLK